MNSNTLHFAYPCPNCDHELTGNPLLCAHCGAAQTPANVRVASLERAALEKRYTAVLSALSPACQDKVKVFENHVNAHSNAVICRDASEVWRLVQNDRAVYNNYYGLVDSGTRRPANNDFDAQRDAIDETMFPRYKNRITMAALTLSDLGSPHYGDCHILLKSTFIEKRASVFECNSLIFIKKLGLNQTIPEGYRAVWQERGRLSATKLSKHITASTDANEFPALLLNPGKNGSDDEFVEVHIHGNFTLHAISKISWPEKGLKGVKTKDLKKKLLEHKLAMGRF